jgi:hypothetical protein
MRLRLVSRRSLIACVSLALLTVFLLPGCSDDDDGDPVGPDRGTTELTGTFAQEDEGGMMTITIQSGTLARALRSGSIASRTVGVSAVLTPEVGAPVHLTGTYREESDTLNLSGGGYEMVGEYDDTTTAISGSYTGPIGPGSFACATGAPGQVGVYCGTFEDETYFNSGRWNLVVAGTQLHGIFATYSGEITFQGTVTGTGTIRTVAVHDHMSYGAYFVVDGTLDTDADTLGGTWGVDDNGTYTYHGPWSASACSTSGSAAVHGAVRLDPSRAAR